MATKVPRQDIITNQSAEITKYLINIKDFTIDFPANSKIF